MNYENDEIVPERSHIRRIADKGAYVPIQVWLLLAFFGTLGVAAVVAWLIYIFHTYPLVELIFVCATASVPFIGIAGAMIYVLKAWKKADTHDIGQYGTVFRQDNGRIQVVSTSEMYAMESQDALRTNIPQIEAPRMEVPRFQSYMQFAVWFNSQFPDQPPIPTMTPMETLETLVKEPARSYSRMTYEEPLLDDEGIRDELLDELHVEEQVAKQEVESATDRITMQRIQAYLDKGLSHRNIAKRVQLTGRKYAKYRQLCSAMGIDTAESID